jgi:hypothetical protein
LFWQAKKGLSFVLAFESARERNAAIMLARRFAFDCNVSASQNLSINPCIKVLYISVIDLFVSSINEITLFVFANHWNARLCLPDQMTELV